MSLFDKILPNRRDASTGNAEMTQSSMKGVNPYWKQLNQREVEEGKHRESIGGLWEELGLLQFEYLRQQGLLPEHKFLDVGCGSLRGGVHFIPYLNRGNYFGLDLNASYIEAGKVELRKMGCTQKDPTFIVNEAFEFSKFGVQVDCALAFSVFTHLFSNHIGRCLVEMRKVLKPTGSFYATFFEAPGPIHLHSIQHPPGIVTTKYDSDPFHYSLSEMHFLAASAGLSVEMAPNWSHPRGQKMLRFSLKSA